MKRRNFVATTCAAIAAPVAAVFGGKQSPETPVHSDASSDLRTGDFHSGNAWVSDAYDPTNPLATKPIRLDYSHLEYLGNEYLHLPVLVLNYSRDGSPPKLQVHKWQPTRVFRVGLGPRDDDPAGPHELVNVAEFDLADPNQVLLAGAIVDKVYDSGGIGSSHFVRSWNQAVIDAQRWQYTEEGKNYNPDEPIIHFIAESEGIEFPELLNPESRDETA
jgi:hypothetical protein